jgi:hypothetical protein
MKNESIFKTLSIISIAGLLFGYYIRSLEILYLFSLGISIGYLIENWKKR